jgi:Zn-dependent peptidase ImmA (M78 family)
LAERLLPDETLQPWAQGYLLADEVLERLERQDQVPVDIDSIAQDLGIHSEDLELSDANVRAISILGPFHKPTIFINTDYKDGTFDWVRRFSQAHELAHLLLDRDRGLRVSVASGPWAPLAIEQRANAFAAALLMPEHLLRAALPTRIQPKRAWDTVDAIAKRFRVSRLAAIDRIYNLGLLERDQRDALRGLALAEAHKSRAAGSPAN